MKVFLVVLIVMILASLQLARTEFNEDKLMTSHVSVNEVISELQFSVYSKEEWQAFFDDYKEEYITREMVFDILTKLGTVKVIPFDEVGKQQAVDRAEWNGIYEQLLDYLDIEKQVEVKEVLVLEREEGEVEHSLYTNAGVFTTTLPITYFSDWESYSVYMLDTECVGVVAEAETEAVISNVYITSITDGSINFLFDGRDYEKAANIEETAVTEGVADITIFDTKITAIGQKQDYIIGHLLSYDDTTIEVEGYGRINHQSRLPVYRVYDKVEELALSDIILGNMDVKCIIGQDEVCAILITAPAEVKNVRILLLTSSGGKFREEVYLTCDSNFSVTCEEKTETIEAGTVVDAAKYISSSEETVIITPNSEGALTYICDKNGKGKSNGYSGVMEVRQYEYGYCVVNEVDLETYLYSVVPSEMPSNYQPEALKAQAVCARSYAYIQVVRADLAAYGAHINDSTSYQVYNNVAKTQASIKAVDETAGTVMLYEGDVIEAYYFSTSMGYTDTAKVWNVLDEAEYGYLKQACVNQTAYDGDLSDESVFKEYLSADVEAYDSNIKFYRWQIKADYSGLTDEIKDILIARRSTLERNITYYKADGETEVDSMKGFGDLESIEVAARSESGSILELMLQFEKGYAKVQSEYNIRKVLGTGASSITYKDGSKSECSGLIPSAFCTVEKQEDGTYLLCGGGYGHGLGMSQNAANGLAKAGYDYVEILNYFYNNIELVDIRS